MKKHSLNIFKPTNELTSKLPHITTIGISFILLLWAAFSFSEILDTVQERLIKSTKDKMRNDLDIAMAYKGIGLPQIDAFWSLHERIIADSTSHTSFKRKCESLERRFGCRIKLYLFQDGRSTMKYPPNAENSEIICKILKAVKSPPKNKIETAKLDAEAIQLLGKAAKTANLRKYNADYIPITTKSGRGLGYFAVFASGLSMAFLVENLENEVLKTFFTDRIKTAKFYKQIGYAIPDIGFWVPPAGRSIQSMMKAWKLANATHEDSAIDNNIIWMFDKDRMGNLTAILRRQPETRIFKALKCLCFILACILPCFVWKIAKNVSDKTESLRTRMQILFALAVFLPMLSTLGIGILSIEDQHERLRDNAFANCMAKLHVVNSGYNLILGEFAQNFRTIFKLVSQNPFDIRRISAQAIKLHQARLYKQFFILDIDNQTFYQIADSDDKEITSLVRLLARNPIKTFLSHRIRPENRNKILPADLLAEQLTSNAELGWAEVTEVPDVVHRLQSGFAPIEIIWNVFKDLATGPAFMAAMNNTSDLMRIHLLRSAANAGNNARMFVFEGQELTVQPRPIPEEFPTLRKLMRVSHLTGKNIQREIQSASGTAWIVVMPDSIVHKFATAAVFNADKALTALDKSKFALALGLLLSLLTSIAAGKLLASLVLLPIADLETGIEAIRKRKSNFVIPCRRDDEFGKLAKIFNRTLGELKELELARIVQTSLLPAEVPQINDYTLAAINISASDLSGDYYDLIKLEDGSLLMLIGDVTGHGASAALAMAMAKAAVAYSILESKTQPTQILNALNEVFFKELKANRKYMTMLMVSLNPYSHILKIETAGHNYPLLHVYLQKSTSYLEMSGLPLGFKKRPIRDTSECRMEPGDVFVMYTDGYTECPTPSGDQIGDQALREILHKICQEPIPAQDILDSLLQEFNSLRKPGPLNDDVTLVVLRRNV